VFKPSKLRAYLVRAREVGLCPEEILEGSGTRWSDIEALRPLDLDVIAKLFDLVARRTPPGFAVRCGSVSRVRDFGIVGFAMMSMPTLRAAFDHWNRYCLVAGHPLVTTLSEDGDQWCMQFVPRGFMSEEARRFCIEASLAALEPVIEELTGTPPATLRIDFAFSQPSSLEDYGHFGTPNLRFGRSTTTYYGKRTDLDRPIPARDSELSDLFHRQCADFLTDLTNTRPLSERLEELMRASAGTMPSLDEMADTLKLSRRSLQRELRSQGITYQQLVKQFRIRHAMALLEERRTNIKGIAFMLGFKDVGSFRRAFHEWTGQAIGEWQANHRKPGLSGGRFRAPVEQSLRRVAAGSAMDEKQWDFRIFPGRDATDGLGRVVAGRDRALSR
jgi:AraC-like DNA-binding protein